MMRIRSVIKGKWVTGALLALCTLAMGKLNIEAWNTFSTEKAYTTPMEVSQPSNKFSSQAVIDQYSLAEELVLSVRDFAHQFTKLGKIILSSTIISDNGKVNTLTQECATYTVSYQTESEKPVSYSL